MTAFRRDAPPPELRHIVECYWTVEGAQRLPERQKIIPDAFTELIFHFGDPYRIKLSTRWETQGRSLLAGQISKHFYLENTGTSRIFGIKLRPPAITHLFGIAMHELTNKVIELDSLGRNHELVVLDKAVRYASAADRKLVCERFFMERKDRVAPHHPVDSAVSQILTQHGMVGIKEIADALDISERYLEQMFKKYVGLSPKLFSRIVRFSYIFQLIKENSPDWSDVVFRSGFYDQSHFIRNFKAFTGEDPSRYMFDRKDLANFFLKEKG